MKKISRQIKNNKKQLNAADQSQLTHNKRGVTLMKKSLFLSTCALATAFSGLSGVASIAHAQEADAGLDQVVITAQRREENLQEVPTAVSVRRDEI